MGRRERQRETKDQTQSLVIPSPGRFSFIHLPLHVSWTCVLQYRKIQKKST